MRVHAIVRNLKFQFLWKKGFFLSVFSFVDEVVEVKKGESLTAFFTLRPSEEFLKDHFADFPVMPGVLQLEALRQAASKLLNAGGRVGFFRLESALSVKYGQFVKPGSRLKIFVRFLKEEGGAFFFEGRADLMDQERLAGRVALADFSLVPVK